MQLLLERDGRRTMVMPEDKQNRYAIIQIMSYAFDWAMNPDIDEEELARKEPYPRIATYAEDGTMLAGCQIVCEPVYLRGRQINHGGIRAVASLPWARRQGSVGMVLIGACRYMKDQGMPLSALYPFSYAFYRQYGWELVQRVVTYKIPISDLKPFSKAPGQVTQVVLGPELNKDPNFAQLSRLYTALARTKAASFLRSEHWWQRRVLADLNRKRFACLYSSQKDSYEGYIIYTLSRDSSALEASEMVWLTPAALKGLLSFVYNHDSMVKTFTCTLPWNEDIQILLDNPRCEASVNSRMMMRVVDVLPVLQHLAADYRGPEVRIKVTDPHLAWNNCVFAVSPNSAAKQDSDDADVEFTVQRLAQAVCGYMLPSNLVKLGLITQRRPFDLAEFDTLFSTGPDYVPFMNDYF